MVIISEMVQINGRHTNLIIDTALHGVKNLFLASLSVVIT
jgi:hypothetical protein